MAKLTREERTEYIRLMDIDYDPYEELTPEQLVRYRELGVRYDEEEDRRREYMDEAYDRDEDFRDED
jgi:hypothetical protein